MIRYSSMKKKESRNESIRSNSSNGLSSDGDHTLSASGVYSSGETPGRDNDQAPESRNTLKIALIALAVLLLTGGVTYLLLETNIILENQQEKQTDQQTGSQNPDQDNRVSSEPTSHLSAITYAHGSDYDTPATIYSRTFSDGSRTKLGDAPSVNKISTSRSVPVSRLSAYAQNENGIMIIDDNGEPERVYSLDRSGYFISGVTANPMGDKIAFAVVPEPGGSENQPPASLRVLDVSTKETTTVLENAKASRLFWMQPVSWSADGSKIVLGGWAHGTDAPRPTPEILDTETNDTRDLTPINGYELMDFAVNSTGGKVAYVQATDTGEGFGGYGAPYTLFTKDIGSDGKTEITTFQEDIPNLQWYWDNPEMLAYAHGQTIQRYNTEDDQTRTAFDTTGPAITGLPAISTTQALFIEHQDAENIFYYHVDMEQTESTRIMTGTNVTEPINVKVEYR